MKQELYKKTVTLLVILIAVFATSATIVGIFSSGGPGQYVYKSIRGRDVTIYGKGLYKDMSAEVAPQGIAQDIVTLLIAIPLLLISLFLVRNGSQKGKYMLAGSIGYFLITYLFYSVMGMYNKLFLVYVALMGLSFFAFILTLLAFERKKLQCLFARRTPVKATGCFLFFTSASIAMLWLSIVVPPLLTGQIIPVQVEHYTTLIVQALDLGILLPAALICGVLFIRKNELGYLLTPIYFIFLSLLMTALTAKVIAMGVLGYNIIPVVFLIPTFNIITVICSIVIMKNVVELPVVNKQINYEKTYAVQ
jgi:hypothetical protein